MCGLVGVFDSTKLAAVDVKCFKNMLYADALRGHHSTGVFSLASKTAAVKDNKLFGEVSKEAGSAYNALNTKGSTVASAITTKAALLMGHNRYATMGEHTARNAHPFEHGDVVLAHNGTLWCHSDLTTEYFEIDSEAVCKAVSEAEPSNVGDVIKKLKGAFTLTWWDYRDESFNIVRNDERPMFLATNGNCLYYASEKLMLEWCMSRNHITPENVQELPVGKHYKWKLHGFKAIEPVVADVELSSEEDPWLNRWTNSWKGGGAKSYKTFLPKKGADKEAGELGYKKGDLVPVWMYDFKPNSGNSVLGRWEGITQDDAAIVVKSFQGTQTTFNLKTGYTWCKISGFFYTTGADGKKYLTFSVDAQAYSETEFINQLATPLTEKEVPLADGKKISDLLARELVTDGCAICESHLFMSDVEQCMFNSDQSQLICGDCLTDYGLMNHFH